MSVSVKQETIIENKPIYFKGLNAYRFIAASLVVLIHADSANLNKSFGIVSIFPKNDIGSSAVTFFFVLSGFLITYLLLEEKSITHTINVRKFYMRRILRIWPLYYLVLLIAFFFLNNQYLFHSTIATSETQLHSPYNFLLYLFFLPNVAWWLNYPIHYANQLWSVGVEEQFYIFWPLVAKYLPKKAQLLFMISFIVAFIAVRNGLFLLSIHLNERHLGYFAKFLEITRIDCMAIGGIGAYTLYYHQHMILKLVSSTTVDVFITCLVIIMILFGFHIPYINIDFYSLIFCYIIISSSCKEKSILQMEGRAWSFLGRLSYGIYMWHMVVIAFLLFVVKKLYISEGWLLNTLFYAATLPLTVLVAWLSFRYIEKPFLTIKRNFVLVKSRAS